MATALGYVRISKDEEGSVSLDYQRAEIEKLGSRMGVTIIGIPADEGISGKALADRARHRKKVRVPCEVAPGLESIMKYRP